MPSGCWQKATSIRGWRAIMCASLEGQDGRKALMMPYGIIRLIALTMVATGVVGAGTAHALTIELKDVAPDRVERQRAAAAGALPLPGTPNVAFLQERLRDKGVTLA